MKETPGETANVAQSRNVGARRGPRTSCTHHCPACSSHFTSQAAFDAHRRGKPGARYCDTDAVNEDGEALLVIKSENGSCDLQRPPCVSGCVIWSTPNWWKAAQSFGRAAA